MENLKRYAIITIFILSLVACKTPLIKAVDDGDLKTVTTLLDQGADINECIGGPWGCPLAFAIVNRQPEMVKLLLDKGADVNGHTKENNLTPLTHAIFYEEISIIQMLLEKGADVNIVTNVKVSHSVGAKPGYYSPMQMAEQKGNPQIIKMLKAAQANTTLGYTPVMYSGSAILIAVIDFDAKGVTSQDAMRVSEWLRNEMINTGQFKVIERSAMNAILKEQAFAMTGCTDTSCAVEVGKLLSARKMLVGSVESWNNKIFINGRIIDVEKGVAEFAHKETVSSVKELDTGAANFAKNLARRINGLQSE